MKLELSNVLRVKDPALDDISHVVGMIIGFLRDQNIHEKEFLDEFELAATEAITNAIQHGCQGAREKFFRAEVLVRPGEVELRVADPSAFAGWSGAARLPDDPLAESGRGRFLMEKMTTSQEHRLEDGHHVLILKKAFGLGTTWDYKPGMSEERFHALNEELASSHEMINALIGLGELLALADEMSLFMNLALARLCELTGAEAAYLRLENGDGLELGGQVGTEDIGLVDAISPKSGCVEARVFANGEEVIVTDGRALAREDPLSGRIESAFLVPIFFNNERRGVMVVAKRTFSAFFSPAQLKVMRVVAEYLGITCTLHELQQRRETEQRALRELEIAAEIQLSFLPTRFDIAAGLDIFGTCEPALKAGGDYFDVIVLPDGAVFVVMADVMGKGISAALLANMFRTNIRSLVQDARDPGRLLETVNRTMSEDLAKLEMFITAACVWISPDRKTICEVNAGHPAGLLIHGRASDRVLKSQGLPVGVLPETTYETHAFAFERGDGLLLFTDGILEAESAAEGFFDMARLQKTIEAAEITSSEELVKRILHRVHVFAGHGSPTDDRTLLSVIRTS